MLMTKKEKLRKILSGFDRIAVAFSGGVDSTFLLKASKELIGDGVLAITAVNDFVPAREVEEMKTFCEKEGIRHICVSIDVASVKDITKNPVNRCYLCKREIMGQILRAAEKEGVETIFDGSNIDDMGDYRPGVKALEELGIRSPLKEAGLTKKDIRVLSKELGLKTWNKPSYSCLATRIPYGEEITKERLAMIDKAEVLLGELGFSQLRVRCHGKIARIEVLPEDIKVLAEDTIRNKVCSGLKDLGFDYVTIDMAGYRTGSMNEVL